MPMTGEGLAAMRKQYVDAVGAPQTYDTAAAIGHGDVVLEADSRAIVDYIKSNAKATGSDSDGDSHDLAIV